MKRMEQPAGWIAIGIGFGSAMGVAFDNIPMGVSTGAVIGIALMALQRKRDESDRSGD